MDNEDEPLTGPERDALRVASRDVPDGFLMSLLAMARQGLKEQVGLLVNGMIVVGDLSSPEALAELLHMRRAAQSSRAERPEGLSDDEWDELLAQWISEPSRAVAQQRVQEELLERDLRPYAIDGPPDRHTLPGELERQLESLRTYSHITLTNATLTAPGLSNTTTVPVMRIAVRQISGWWVAPLNEDGSSSIRLWAGEQRMFGDD